MGAVCEFCQTLRNAGLINRFYFINIILPGDLDRMLFPLLQVGATGFDPWVNHGFVAGDLTVNGLQGDGVSRFIDTGYVASVPHVDYDNSGMSVMRSVFRPGGVFCQMELGSMFISEFGIESLRISVLSDLSDVGLGGHQGLQAENPIFQSVIYFETGQPNIGFASASRRSK